MGVVLVSGAPAVPVQGFEMIWLGSCFFDVETARVCHGVGCFDRA